MPRITELCEDFAERFAFEPSRVLGIAKALREAGLLKAGPRGKNAPDATALDAARILIGMMLRVKQDEVAEGVSLFGSFPANIKNLNGLNAPATFELAFAEILDRCATKGKEWYSNKGFEVKIIRDYSYASVFIAKLASDDDPRMDDDDFYPVLAQNEFRYLHPEMLKIQPNDPLLHPDLLEGWRKYRSGFHEEPVLLNNDLREISEVLAGRIPPKKAPDERKPRSKAQS